MMLAYYQQATVGPNNEPRPSCLVSFFSTSDIDQKWTSWKNLGNLSKEDASTKFLGEVMHVKPDFMNVHVASRGNKYSLRAIMQRDAAEKIQVVVRGMIARNRFLQSLYASRTEDVQKLIDLLIVGIPVKVLRSNGGVMSRKKISLVMGESLQESRLCICTQSKEVESSAFLVDIADIRLGVKTVRFKRVQRSVVEDECFSIIFSDKSFDLQVLGDSTTRNWIAGLFVLLIDRILPQKEASRRGLIKGRRYISCPRTHRNIEKEARKFGDLLVKSFGVEVYFEGTLQLQVISMCWQRRRMFISSYESINRNEEHDGDVSDSFPSSKGIDLDDIAEVRAGIITLDMDKNIKDVDKMITIVGSEASITLKFQLETVRDKFLARMHSFVAFFKTPVRSFRGILPPTGTQIDIETTWNSCSACSLTSKTTELSTNERFQSGISPEEHESSCL